MAHIVIESCIGCKHADCVDVCPVDCFHQDEKMLLIDPFECIDCGACIPACPEEAIYEEADVPAESQKWIAINADKAPGLPVISNPEDLVRIEPESHCQ